MQSWEQAGTTGTTATWHGVTLLPPAQGVTGWEGGSQSCGTNMARGCCVPLPGVTPARPLRSGCERLEDGEAAARSQFIRKSPVNWVLAGLCWGSGTHGLGIWERQYDACQTSELWWLAPSGQQSPQLPRCAPPRRAAIVGAVNPRAAPPLLPARIVCRTSWASQFKNTYLGFNPCCCRAQRLGRP